MVDRKLLAAKLAAVRRAVGKVRAALPASEEAFRADETARDLMTLNLFVAVQECIASVREAVRGATK